MKEKNTKLILIEDTTDLQILLKIDGKRNITDISRISGYTYKSTYYRIIKMQKLGWIELKKHKDITRGATLNIKKDFRKKIEHELSSYQTGEIKILEAFKNKEIKESTKELLKFIEDNRLVSEHNVLSFMFDKHQLNLKLINLLKKLGYIRSRLEISRSGKKLLNECSLE